MVAVFQEVNRVLAQDGTLWLNLGDSYSNDTKWGGTSGGKNYTSAAGGYQGQRVRHGNDCDPKRGAAAPGQPISHGNSGLKPKNLVGMPWRVAFALQADGWYLRSDIIWAKPNPMPESVTDRPTKAHEYIFLLAKSERYYFAADEIAEPSVDPESIKGRNHRNLNGHGLHDPEGFGRTHAGFAKMPVGKTYLTRNPRSVWMIPTQSYTGAHFATFPEAIPEKCIKAGSRPGDLVLDPFGGSGTTGRVAERLNRRWVCMDLKYHELSDHRTRNVQKELLAIQDAADSLDGREGE